MNDMGYKSPGELYYGSDVGTVISAIDDLIIEKMKEKSIDFTQEYFPILLRKETLSKTGYLKRGNKDCIYVYNPDIKNPNIEYVLTPSACFHIYEKYEHFNFDKEKVFTLKQHVFRDEINDEWRDEIRLRDYQIREIVFFGSKSYVEIIRTKLIDVAESVMEELNIPYSIKLSTDSFVHPIMKRYQQVQIEKKSKYELIIKYFGKEVAVASFNLHDRAFTGPFDINVNQIKTYSGCVGFGLERIALCYLKERV
ncbi:MAG: hypothetical protein K6F77_08820 [Lachnospiraceae bacterium]|nr:hypothetical protein [Lachnospiraceae bacterium]